MAIAERCGPLSAPPTLDDSKIPGDYVPAHKWDWGGWFSIQYLLPHRDCGTISNSREMLQMFQTNLLHTHPGAVEGETASPHGSW